MHPSIFPRLMFSPPSPEIPNEVPSVEALPAASEAKAPELKVKRPKLDLASRKKSGPPNPADYPAELERSQSQHRFRWDNVHSYSVSLGAGYGRYSFLNGKGLEHQGLEARLAVGLRLPLGKWRDHVLLPRIFYQYQGNNAARIGNTYLSRAQSHRFGVELNYLYEAVPTWLQVGAVLSLGGAIYRSKDGFLQGLIFNGKALPRPLDSSGIHASAGALLCTFNGAVCLAPEANLDLGMGLGLEPAEAKGFSLSLRVDALRFFHWPTPRAVAKKYGVSKRQ